MTTLNVGVAGLGTIGRVVAAALDDGIKGLRLHAITTRSGEKAASTLEAFARPVPLVSPEALADGCDIIAECVPKTAFADIARPAIHHGRVLVTVSGGALLEYQELIDLAAQRGATIVLASGAILGLDALKAAAEGTIHSVTMVTRKPPAALDGAPYLEATGVNLDNLDAPMKLFEGSAREGVRGFPANVNVAAAVGLAGVGVDATRLEIWADPGLTRNTHTITVEADSARFELHIENVPSESNPGTGRITALSVIAALRNLVAPVRVGS